MIIRIAAASIVTLGLIGGCGGDECTRASDHYLECFPEDSTDASSSSTTSGGGGRQLECSDKLLCEATCVNAASCKSLTMKDQEGFAEYLACIDACGDV